MINDDNIVVLTDNDGNELECDYLDTITYNDMHFVILYPLDQDKEEGEVIILELVENEEGEEEYITVEDEDLLDEVFDQYIQALELEEE